MNASTVLWEKWHEQVKGLLPGIHGHQKKTLALLVLGMVVSGSAVLQRVAESLQERGLSQAKMSSIERRLARFVANERIVVPRIWQRFLAEVCAAFRDRQCLVVLDCTPLDERACIIYLGLLVQSRVLPLAWRVMPGQESWEQGQWELVAAMLDEVRAVLGRAECTLIADRGLAGAPLVRLCRERQWHYLLRIGKEHTLRRRFRGKWAEWVACQVVVRHQGQQWFGEVLLWQEETLQTYLSAVWEPGHQEAWFLISDQPAGWRRVRQYAWRMRVESTFQESKSRGWDLEASLIADRQRLDRLLLALFVAMWWVIHLAACCIHHGHRDRFDRHDRRDKSLFRLGCLWLKDILRRARHPASLTWCLPFKKLSSGWKFSLRF